MEKGIAEVMHNDSQTAKVSLSDVHNMFGTWKETDHCDKDFNN
jgi:hypothetical protein